MPLRIQKEWFTKEQIQSDRNVWYVFGDNEMRQGTGGQAKPCRGEPNTIGIRTKRKPLTGPDAYWTDETYDENCMMIDEDFANVEGFLTNTDCLVILPADGIGTGLAKLSENAPETLKYIEQWISHLTETYGEDSATEVAS